MIRTLIVFLCAMMTMAMPSTAMEHEELQTLVEEVRAEHDLVGLGAVLLFANGEAVGPVVDGLRRKGSDEAIEPGDSFHIGSNTKMLTALLYAKRVEQGRMQWGATLPELFPDLADTMHPDWETVTIEELFSHRSGLAANPSMLWFITSRSDQRSLTEQRLDLTVKTLTSVAPNPRGEFQYSNLGYMIAGAALEAEASSASPEGEVPSYEEMFADVLLAHMSEEERAGWGFGPPQVGPVGHGDGMFSGTVAKGRGSGADNPLALGPAGTAHAPLLSHARLLLPLLMSAKGEGDYERLLTPYPDESADYALGIGIGEREGLGRYYGHSGSNTFWLSQVSIIPNLDAILVVGCNQWSPTTRTAISDLERKIFTTLLEED